MFMKKGKNDFSKIWTEVTDPGIITLTTAALVYLNSEISRRHFNLYQKELESPFDNIDPGHKFEVPYFTITPYDFDADGPQTNFECDVLQVRWHKHLGIGMEVFVRKGMNPADAIKEALTGSLRCIDAWYKAKESEKNDPEMQEEQER